MTPFRRRSNRLQPVKTQSTFHCSRNTAPVDFCSSSFKKPNPDSGTQTASLQQVRIQSPPPHLRLVQRLLPTLQSQSRPKGSAAHRKRSAEEKVAPANAPTSRPLQSQLGSCALQQLPAARPLLSLQPAAALPNKSTAKQHHGFQVYYPDVISNCSHLLQKCLFLLPPLNAPSAKLSSLPFASLTSPPLCKLCGPNWLSYTCLQILVGFSKIHIIVHMTVAQHTQEKHRIYVLISSEKRYQAYEILITRSVLCFTKLLIYDSEHIEGADTLSTEQEYKLYLSAKKR